jgi:hypothetical protein
MIYLKTLTLLAITFLYSFGGANNTSKIWRRIAIPIIVSLYKLNLLGLLLIIPLMLGYGEDSSIRKFYKGSNFLTRLTISIIMTIALILITHKLVNILFITWYLFWTALCKVDDKMIKIWKWELNLEELLIGLGIAVVIIA